MKVISTRLAVLKGRGLTCSGCRTDLASWCVLLLVLGVTGAAGCKPAIPTGAKDLPDLVGEWAYTATDIRVVGRPQSATCQIRDVKLFLGPWRHTGFFGRSEGGVMTCTGDLSALSEEFPPYAVRNGGSVLNFIAFDIGSSDWRHDGTIAGDTMSGRFWIQHPGLRLEGLFKAVLTKGGAPDPTIAASVGALQNQ